MKVLQFCSKPPLPAVDGGCLASYRLGLDLLNAGFDLQLFCLATEKHPFYPSRIDEDFREKTKMKVIPIDSDINIPKAFINLLESESIQKRRFRNEDAILEFTELLQSETFDLIIFDEYRSAFYLNEARKYSKAKCVYRSVNIEYSLMEGRSKTEPSALKKAYLKLQTKRLRNFEASLWKQVDEVWSISENDIIQAEKLNWEPARVRYLPFSMELPITMVSGKNGSLFHLGSMEWEPNIEGIRWFCKEVWPNLRKEDPSLSLNLGGKAIDQVKDLRSVEGATIHDQVENAEEFCARFDILVVPLFSGSGTRIKILQAMARGNVVVSTRRGMKGIAARPGLEYIEANNASEFTEGILETVRNEAKKLQIKENARRFMNEHHNEILNAEMLTKWAQES